MTTIRLNEDEWTRLTTFVKGQLNIHERDSFEVQIVENPIDSPMPGVMVFIELCRPYNGEYIEGVYAAISDSAMWSLE